MLLLLLCDGTLAKAVASALELQTVYFKTMLCLTVTSAKNVPEASDALS